MSLIICPECRAKISEKAISCPSCGFCADDITRPIGEQEDCEPMPTFAWEIEEWRPINNSMNVISYNDNQTFFEFFGKWKNIEKTMPDIAKIIKELIGKETIAVAEIDRHIKKMIDKGIYKFITDKNGEILPVIMGADGQFVKQVRLKEVAKPPQIEQAIGNLQTQMALAEVLEEIKVLGNTIENIQVDLQNDRLALGDSAKAKLTQALMIEDRRLKEIAILNAINNATDAKCTLIRNFSQNLKFMKENSDEKPGIKGVIMSNSKDVNKNAVDAFQGLVTIFNAVQVECKGYAALGELDAGRECLIQFKDFIQVNELDNRDTLLLINECAGTNQKQNQLVGEFIEISKKITNIQNKNMIESNAIKRIEG